MKSNLFILLTIILLQSCSKPSSTVSTNEDLIKKVETSLIASIYIAGDSTWTIEERMAHTSSLHLKH